MNRSIGSLVRTRREELKASDIRFSLRQVAGRIGVQPSFLSKVESGIDVAVSEEKIRALAEDLSLEADVLLALNGKISSEVQEIIIKRPVLFSQIIRELKKLPDHAILRIVREVRDGDW